MNVTELPTTPTRIRVGVVGGGVMGETLLAAILQALGEDRGASGADASGAGERAGDVVVAEKRAVRREELAAAHPVTVVEDPAEAVAGAQVVVLAVKPQDIGATLDRIGDQVLSEALVVSVLAGVGTARLEAGLPSAARVVRVMPNLPARIGRGASAMCAGSTASTADLEQVRQLLAATGTLVAVDEAQMDTVTGLSGSGPAYAFLVIEALEAAGVELGLPRSTARELAVQTVAGAAEMVGETGSSPAALREDVTSPGGTTAAGVAALEERGVRAAVAAGVRAAAQRSQELG